MASGEDGDASEESADGTASGAAAAEGDEDGERGEEEGAGSGGEGGAAAAAAATEGEERRRPVAPLFSFPPGPRVRRTEAEDSLQVNAVTGRNKSILPQRGSKNEGGHRCR